LDYNWQEEINDSDVVERSWKKQGDNAEMRDTITVVTEGSKIQSGEILFSMNPAISSRLES
jgi:hypothetical protein